MPPPSVRRLYADALADPGRRRSTDFAPVGIGHVSGDNAFFHLTPSDARRLRIPLPFLQPSLRNGKAMPEDPITDATAEGWRRNEDMIVQLRLTAGQDLPAALRGYLQSAHGRVARQWYKCRNRSPWYAVPDVQIPAS